jgi:hypothetical protein
MTDFVFSAPNRFARLFIMCLEWKVVGGPGIAATSGDPAGIGPEILARGAAAPRPLIAKGELSLLLARAGATHPAVLELLDLNRLASPARLRRSASDHPDLSGPRDSFRHHWPRNRQRDEPGRGDRSCRHSCAASVGRCRHGGNVRRPAGANPIAALETGQGRVDDFKKANQWLRPLPRRRSLYVRWTVEEQPTRRERGRR